jgi:uncharacterized protein
MTAPARISLVTLAVADVTASTAFYEALGWPLSPASVPGDVSFFKTAGAILAIWGVDELRADAGLPATSDPPAFRGVALAINCVSEDEVDEAMAAAETAGGRVIKPPRATEWGGYTGYFTDPDGHAFEVAYNPGWPLGADERPGLP